MAIASAPRISIEYADEFGAFVVANNVFATILRRPFNLGLLHGIRRYFERLDPAVFRRSVGFTLVGENAMGLSMSPEVRSEVNALTRSFSTPGVAIVLETNGFAMAAARTIIGGLILLGGQGKMRVFASTPDAASWLSDVSCKMGGAVVSKDLLAQVIAQADAAIRAS